MSDQSSSAPRTEAAASACPRRIAVYPGSFDPIHNGHLDIIDRCRPMFDEIVVAVLRNTSKKPLFSNEERFEMISEIVAPWENCRVETFEGLLVHFMDQIDARFVVRGLRAVSDFESEVQMALMNRRLNAQVETVFLAATEEFGYLASRLIKEIHVLGGDVQGLVPEPVLRRLAERDL